MKKTSLLVAALAFASIASGFAGSSAATCSGGTSTARTATDPFGSCENGDGSVKCGAGTDVPMVGVVIVDPAKGAQACADDARTTPIAGRITVYKDANNNVTVSADGGDKKNSAGAAAWQRYDVRPGDGQVCARRGDGGTYWTGANGGKGTSTPNSVNEGVPAKCQ